MHTSMPSNALDHYARQQLSRQWQGFLAALAEEFQSQLEIGQLRELMSGIGTRFAITHPLADCPTIDMLAGEMNALWGEHDWGFVELVDAHHHLDIRHWCAPLAAFGIHATGWAPAFLEGVYRHWLHEAGAHALSITQQDDSVPHEIRFRLSR